MRAGRLAIICLVLVSGQAAAEVYKFIDKNGIAHYTDRKPVHRQYRLLNMDCIHYGRYCPGGKAVDWHSVPLYKNRYSGEIRKAARQHAVPEHLVRAVIHAESSFNPKAISNKGAQGLMQLMPATQRYLRVSHPFNPADNIDGGVRYLAEMLERFGGNQKLACAAYHAGPTTVMKYGGVPPYDSTKNYLERIRILSARYRKS